MSARTPDPRFLPTREQIAALRADARRGCTRCAGALGAHEPACPYARRGPTPKARRAPRVGQCTVAGCFRRAHADALCQGHYDRRRGRTLAAPAGPAVGARVAWHTAMCGRRLEGRVVAIVARGASAWSLCPEDVGRERLIAKNVVRAFVRALVAVEEGGRVVYYAPRVERLEEVR